MALTTDLISYWKFDGDATDSVGSNDGTVTGATNGSAYGKINEGYLFDASTEKIEIASTSNPLTNGLGAFSISIWVYPTSATTRCVLSSRDATGTYGIIFYSLASSFACTIRTSVSGLISPTSTSAPNINAWNHVVVTYDGANSKIYVDGTLEGTTAQTGTLVIDSGEEFTFARNGTNTSQSFLGYEDECGIWSRALTSTEVSELYNSGDGLQYPFSASSGWTGKINGVTNPAKVNAVAVADISKINGVE